MIINYFRFSTLTIQSLGAMVIGSSNIDYMYEYTGTSNKGQGHLLPAVLYRLLVYWQPAGNIKVVNRFY